MKSVELKVDLPDLNRIEVTAEDIKDGKAESTDSCPIALAVKRYLGPLASNAEVCIDGQYQTVTVEFPVFIGKKKSTLSFDINLDLSGAEKFVSDFDNYKTFGLGNLPQPKVFKGRPTVQLQD